MIEVFIAIIKYLVVNPDTELTETRSFTCFVSEDEYVAQCDAMSNFGKFIAINNIPLKDILSVEYDSYLEEVTA